MTKEFKYLILNNDNMYLVNSMEEYFQTKPYNGDSLQIEMAPKGGWFDERGRRRAKYGPVLHPVSARSVAVVLKDWQYTWEDYGASRISLAELDTHPWLLDRRNIIGFDAEHDSITSVSPCGAWYAEIRRNEEDADVALFVRKWVNVAPPNPKEQPVIALD